ncbi:MAG: Lrp/AsnC family transcriptional regulator [Promethearchaeota archaeon]
MVKLYKGKNNDIDMKILSVLQEDASISMETLKEILDDRFSILLTRQAVQARVKRLKDLKILRIKGIINHELIGRNVSAFVFVLFSRDKDHSIRELAEQISKIPGVYGVWIVAGEWDLLLKVRTYSIADVGELVVDKVRRLHGIVRVNTIIVFNPVKEEY